MLSTAMFVGTAGPAHAGAIESDIELGGFLAVFDMAALPDGRILGVVGNGVAEFDGHAWRTFRILSDDTFLSAIDSYHDTAWATGGACEVVKITGYDVDIRRLDIDCSLSSLVVERSSGVPILVGRNAEGNGIVLRYDRGSVTQILTVPGAGLWSIAQSAAGDLVMGGVGVVVVQQADRAIEFREEWAGCDVYTVEYVGADTIYAGGMCIRTNPSGSFFEYPVIAKYTDGQWVRETIVNGARAMIDLEIGADGSGWATGSGLCIYRLDGSTWTKVFDGAGSVFSDPMNAVEIIGGRVYFVGSQATMIVFQDGEFVRYMDSGHMSDRGDPFDLPHLARIATGKDGYAVAASEWGSPIERSAMTRAWREMDGPAVDSPIVSVAIEPGGDVWFGTRATRKGGRASFVRRSPTGETLVQSDVTSLSIWDIDFTSSGDGWAVSSYSAFGDPNSRSNIMQLVDGSWVVRCAIEGVALKSVAALSGEGAIAVGTAAIMCTGQGVARSVDGLDGYATGAHRDGDGSLYVSTTKGVQVLADGETELRPILASPDEWILSVAAHDRCVVAFGEDHVWRGRDQDWEIGKVQVASVALGEFEFRDAAVDTSGTGPQVIAAGQFDTIVGIDMSCPSAHGIGTATPATPEPVASPPPSAATRSSIVLPIAHRFDRSP